MDCVILYRVNSGRIEFVYDAENEMEIAVFDRDRAEAYCRDNALFQSGQASYQIVEYVEL
jgi:hypothetical protein